MNENIFQDSLSAWNTGVAECWMIKKNGVFMRVRSGKISWEKQRHAKAALLSHFYHEIYTAERSIAVKPGETFDGASKKIKALYEEWVAENIAIVNVLS